MKFKSSALASVLLFALASVASAQLTANVTVGPKPAPVGIDISVTVSHDAPLGFISMENNAYRIFGPGDVLVYDPPGGGAVFAIGPHGWFTFYWDQRNQEGNQVPPGVYTIEISYDFKPNTYHEIVIDAAAETGILFEGTATTGDTFSSDDRNFYLSAPGEAGSAYWLIGSLSATTGLATCGGTFPLDFDILFSKSAVPNKIFKKSFGTLSANGTTIAPEFPIPNDPSLIGINLYAAFLVVDFDDPICYAQKISPALMLTII